MSGKATRDKRATSQRARNLRVVLPLMGVLALSATAVYYSVPLYRIFCQVTGYGGTTKRANTAPGGTGKRFFTVRFDGTVDRSLPWYFRPVTREITLHAGEERLAHFRATNESDKPVTGSATFNVVPAKAGQYFVKVACFCFTKQHLEARRSADMPVSFYIDPDILKDPNLSDVRTITLSYTFYRTPDERRTSAVRKTPAATKPTKRN